VILAAAGSSDPRALRDVRSAARMLSSLVRTTVRIAYVATGSPRVPEVVATLRAQGARRVFIASYLLADGLFHARLAEAGADGVSAPLGVTDSIVDLVTQRYCAGARFVVAR
jgi:sirohydrochlorin ferrochelatase